MKLDNNFAELLEKNIAGEDINWYKWERYIERVKPRTIRTLMKVTKADGYMKGAGLVRMSTRSKYIILIIGAVIIAVLVVFMIVRGMGMLPF
jgi:hypothetical protein